METQQSAADWYKSIFEPTDTTIAHHELWNDLKEFRPDIANAMGGLKFNFYRANFETFGMPIHTDSKGCLGYKLKVKPLELSN